MLWQQLFNGLNLGLIYALVAMGYTLVFGVLGVVNLGHGAIVMAGAYMGLMAITALKLPVAAAALLVMLACGLLGAVLDLAAVRPHGGRPVPTLVATLGFALALDSVVRLVFGPRLRSFPPLTSFSALTVGPARIPAGAVISLAVSLLMLAGLLVAIRRTAVGRWVRAIAENPELAEAVQINVQVVRSLTVGLASALGGLAGVLWGGNLGVISPYISLGIALKGLVVLIVAGVGSVWGAMVTAVLIGLIEVATVATFSTAYRDVVPYAALLAILLVRPNGLFGRETRW